MIFGAHVVLYSRDAEADRAFFREVLGFSSVDAGHDWLIFALPPAELALHPTQADGVHELFLMCDDLNAEMEGLARKNVSFSDVEEARWGSVTKIQLPGGGEVGLYQPKHTSPLRPTGSCPSTHTLTLRCRTRMPVRTAELSPGRALDDGRP